MFAAGLFVTFSLSEPFCGEYLGGDLPKPMRSSATNGAATHPVAPRTHRVFKTHGRRSSRLELAPHPQGLVALAGGLNSNHADVPRARARPRDVGQNLLWHVSDEAAGVMARLALHSMLWTTRKPPGCSSDQHLSMVANRNFTCAAAKVTRHAAKKGPPQSQRAP